MISIGIFAKVFARQTLDDTLDAVAQIGLTTMQFNMALALPSSLPEQIPAEVAERVRNALAQRGLGMAAVSGTFNMAHPDKAVRDRGGAALGELIRAAPSLGTDVVTLCTGSRDPADMWQAHSDNQRSEAWADMRETVVNAVSVAEAHNVTLAFEPEPNNIVNDAAAGRRLLDEVGSARLRVVIDPANLVLDAIEQQRAVMERAFELLGEEIVIAHAKDVATEPRLVAAGKGLLDYAHYVELLRTIKYDGALVLHGLTPEEAPQSVSFLRARLSTSSEAER